MSFQALFAPLQKLPLLQRFVFNSGSAADQGSARLACDLGTAKITLLEVEKAGSVYSVRRIKKIQRSDIPATETISQALKRILTEGGFQSDKVRISLKGQGTILRFVQFPAMTDEELRGAIQFEAEKYIPFKSDEVIVDYHIVEPSVTTDQGKMMNVLLVAAKKEDVYKLVQVYQEAGLQVELIDVDALAFMNAVEYLYAEDCSRPVGMLDFGSDISTLGILHAGKPLFIRDLSFGNQDFAKRIKRKLGSTILDYCAQLDASPALTTEQTLTFHEIIAPFVSEIRVSLDYFKDQNPGAEIPQKIFLSGVLGVHPVMSSLLSKEFGGLKIQGIEIAGKVLLAEGLEEKEIKSHEGVLPVAFGLCLREI